jgi:hypothetical protein
MIPRDFGQPLRPWDRPSEGAGVQRPRPAVLTINFVRVAVGDVSGILAPYADPETRAKLVTTFQGRLRGDTIEGTYTTRAAGSGDTQAGEWAATRRKS